MKLYDLISPHSSASVKGINRWWHRFVCAAVILYICAFEYFTAPLVLMPFIPVLPILIGCRYGGWRWGAVLAGTVVLWRTALACYWGFHFGWAFHFHNILTLAVALSAIIWLTWKLQEQHNTIEFLRALLPICSHCKAIRDADGKWSKLEDYVAENTSAKFTHGICPVCRKAHFAEYTE